MIRKIFRLLIMLILVTVLGILVYIHTPMFRSMVRHNIENRISAATGETLHIGKLSITPLSGRIQLHNISLANTLSIENLSLKVSVSGLFRFKLIVKNASVKNVTVHVRLKPGHSAFHSDPMKLIAAGFDTLILKKLAIQGLTLDIQGQDKLHITFEGKDFLLQGGFNTASLGYRGIMTFKNGYVTVNGTPYVLHVGCAFDIQKNRFRVTELTIARGQIHLSIKGETDKTGTRFSVSGTVPLKELTVFPELQKTLIRFQLKGDFSILEGPIQIYDPRGKFNGILNINLEKKTVSITNLKGKILKHTVLLSGTASIEHHLVIAAKTIVQGPLMKNFSADFHVEKKKRWFYRAVIRGRDCGNGICRLDIRSGKTPVLENISLHLPFLTSRIQNNRGNIHLTLDWINARATGDFFKDNLFSGKLIVRHLQYKGIQVPPVTADLVVRSPNDIHASRFVLQEKGGRATGSGSFKKDILNLTAELWNLPFHSALFALPETRDLAIDGRGNGTVRVSGNINDPDVNGTITIHNTNIFQLSFDATTADFQYHKGKLNLNKIKIQSGKGTMNGAGTVDFNRNLLAFRLRGTGMKISYQPLDFISIGNNTGEVSISGTLDTPKVIANMQFGQLAIAGLTLGNGTFSFQLTGDRAEIRTHTRNRLDINTLVNLNGKTTVSLQAKQTPIQIDKVKVISSFNFHCDGDFNDLTTFSGKGNCSALSIRMPENIRLNAVPFPFYLDGMWLTGDEVQLKGQEMDYLVNMPFTNFDSGEVGGEITGATTLTAFNTLIKRELGIRARATVKIKGELNGMLANPLYHGTLTFSDGEVVIPDLPHKLTGISGIFEFDPTILNIREFTAYYGRGEINANGILSPALISIDGMLHNVPVDLSGVFADANGHLKLNGKPENPRLNLSGSAELSNGVISPQQLALGDPTGGETVLERLTLNLDMAMKGLKVLDPTMSLGLAPSRLKLKGPADSPILLGIQPISHDSIIYINGIPLKVRSGEIRFENEMEIDPQVEIIAGTRIDGYDISCRLLGNSKQIKLKFSSQPPLPRKDLYALVFGSGGLATGSNTFMQTETRQQDLQGVGVALALNNLFAPLQNRVKRRLGVQRFSITPQMFDARSTPSPIVTFEKDISSRLTGIYSQSLIGSGENLLQFKYNMAGKKTIIARKEIDGSVTVEIEFE